MDETLLIKALASFTGGPKVGTVAEVPARLARPALDAGLAIEVESLEARVPGLDPAKFSSSTTPADPSIVATNDATDKDASNQSGGTWGDDDIQDATPEVEDEPQA